MLQLFFDQEAHGRLRHPFCDTHSRCVRPVRRAERIVHIEISKFRERFREFRIVRLLLRLEPNVLQQSDVAILHMVDDLLGHVANRVVAENDRVMNERVQIIADRAKRIFFHALPLRAAKMRHQNRFRAVLAQVVDRRQALPNPCVISDPDLAATGLDWHVEVHSHQHAFPAYIQIAQ